MDSPWERATQEVDAQYACECKNSIYVYKTDSLKRKVYYRMCVRCRETGQAISVKGLPAMEVENIAEYDDGPAKSRRANKQHERRMVQERYMRQDRDERLESLAERYADPSWETLRQKVLDRCHRRCEGCGEEAATVVHHLTYERLWAEMLFDLVGVCEDCHKSIHPHLQSDNLMRLELSGEQIRGNR